MAVMWRARERQTTFRKLAMHYKTNVSCCVFGERKTLRQRTWQISSLKHSFLQMQTKKKKACEHIDTCQVIRRRQPSETCIKPTYFERYQNSTSSTPSSSGSWSKTAVIDQPCLDLAGCSENEKTPNPKPKNANWSQTKLIVLQL